MIVVVNSGVLADGLPGMAKRRMIQIEIMTEDEEGGLRVMVGLDTL